MNRILILLALPFLTPPASAAAASNWLKPYPQRQHSAIWHFDFEIQGLQQAQERILAMFKNYGGDLTIPLENLASNEEGTYQQLSYRIPRAGAEKALAKLKKMGAMRSSTQKDDDPLDIKDAQERLKRLRKDLSAQKKALERMSAVLELASEMAAALDAAIWAHEQSKSMVLLNLTLQEPAK